MKSPSKNKNKIKSEHNEDVETVQSVNNALNHSANTLTESTLSDIARIRAIALNSNNLEMRLKKSVFDTFIAWLFNPMINIGVPVAAAIMIAISVKYVSVEAIPELPLEMVAANVPTEDFSMLEDLEFVTWLAENEQSALL